jgi:multidrug transporter EmrE-like cation transporter
MNGKRNMFLFYFSITLTIVASALYHFSQKATPTNVNPAVAIMVTYALSFCLIVILSFFIPTKIGFLAEVRQLNWASYLLAFPVVGLEIGFLLVYRSGWNLGIAAVLVNVAASLILVPVALFVFKQRLSLVNIIGILICLAGLVMLNWKR